MKNKEESSFLQGVESRLDSLFVGDTKSVKDRDSDLDQTAAKEVITEIKEDIRKISPLTDVSPKAEIALGEAQIQSDAFVKKDVVPGLKEDIRKVPPLKEISPKAETVSRQPQTQDKSAFISEIEKRFSAIFGEEDKEVSAVTETENPEDIKKMIAEAEQEESKKTDQTLAEVSSPVASILRSPLKDLKSIVLSIEWEINDQILEQFDEEVNKLYLFYTGDRIIQGFLRILRFLGRYIRVRGVSSNRESINLLLSVYDHLENVVVTEGMTEAKKHIVLIENIKKYRSWVETTDIETKGETEAFETKVAEVKPLEVEPLKEKSLEDQKVEVPAFAAIQAAEVKPPEVEPLKEKSLEDQKVEVPAFTDIQVAEEKPLAEVASDKVLAEVMPLQELKEKDKAELFIKEPDILIQAQPTHITEIPPLVHGEKLESAIAAIKNLPPHEAFVYALDEIKKTFQAELDAMKEEIRILKNAR